MGNVVWHCVESLGECLADASANAGGQNQGLNALARIYEYSDRYYIDAFGDVVAKVAHTRLSEGNRRWFAAWLLDYIDTMKGEDNRYGREASARLHLALVGADYSDSEYLAFCNSHGLTSEAVVRLLDLGRPEDAIDLATSGSGIRLVWLANDLVRRGFANLAEKMVQERLAEPRADDCRRWLRERCLQRDDLAGALDIALLDYGFRPALAAYQGAEDLARRLGNWDEIRPGLLRKLREKGIHPETRLDIYLSEEMLPDIAELASSALANRSVSEELLLAAARAVEEEYPDHALTIYRRKANVNSAGPSGYKRVADCLCHMKRIYLRQDRRADWTTFFNPLLARHKLKRNLIRALKDRGVID